VSDIWQLINKAGLIIADITIHNANVYYELGIAHALGKETVLIRRLNGDKTPLDIVLWRYFEYDPQKTSEFADTLAKIFGNYKAKPKNGL